MTKTAMVRMPVASLGSAMILTAGDQLDHKGRHQRDQEQDVEQRGPASSRETINDKNDTTTEMIPMLATVSAAGPII